MITGTLRTALKQQLNRYIRDERRPYWILSPLLALLIELIVLLPLQPTRKVGADPAVFYYGGDLLARGMAPYKYLWDIKPPLIYDLTAAIALVAPNDPWAQFYLGSFITAGASVVCIGMASAIVYRVTKSNVAALITGTMVMGYQTFLLLPRLGVWPKMFSICFGVLAIYCTLEDRRLLGTILGTVSAGCWPFGLVFVCYPLVEGYRSRDRLWIHVVAVGAVGFVGSLPIILTGGFPHMINEVVFTSLSKPDAGAGLFDRLRKFETYTRFTFGVFTLGAVGGVYHAVKHRADWWLGVGILWSVVQLGFLDFDYTPDPMLFVVFAAIGVGMTVGHLTTDQQVIGLLVIWMLVWVHIDPHTGSFMGSPPVDPGSNQIITHFVEQKFPPTGCEIGRAGVTYGANGEPITVCGTKGPL